MALTITQNGQTVATTTGTAFDDGVVQASEINQASELELLREFDAGELAELIGWAGVKDGEVSIEELIAKAGNFGEFAKNGKNVGTKVTETIKKLKEYQESLNELTKAEPKLKEALKKAQTELKKAGADATKKGAAETQIAKIEKQLAALQSAKTTTRAILEQLVKQARAAQEQAKSGAGKKANAVQKAYDKLSAEQRSEFEQQLGVAEAALAESADAGAPALPKGATGKAGAAKSGKATSVGDDGDAPAPTGGGSKPAPGGAPKAGHGGGMFGQPSGGAPFATNPVDFGAFARSAHFEQMRLEGMDEMLKNQAQGQKMMMLFFYLSRMAMSGDLGAMYMFISFLTTIITKDKAMQNIQVGRKLLEMQNDSRELTQALVETDNFDPDNREVEANYAKKQAQIQGELGQIATSQKLLGTVLEEFTQVSEMMTGLRKSLLDARGRELQMISVWR